MKVYALQIMIKKKKKKEIETAIFDSFLFCLVVFDIFWWLLTEISWGFYHLNALSTNICHFDWNSLFTAYFEQVCPSFLYFTLLPWYYRSSDIVLVKVLILAMCRSNQNCNRQSCDTTKMFWPLFLTTYIIFTSWNNQILSIFLFFYLDRYNKSSFQNL